MLVSVRCSRFTPFGSNVEGSGQLTSAMYQITHNLGVCAAQMVDGIIRLFYFILEKCNTSCMLVGVYYW